MLGFLKDDKNVLQNIMTAAPRQSGSSPEVAPEHDNGYHFPQFRSGSSDQWYTEWWYFNFYDPASQVSGIVVYQVVNPASRWFSGKARLLMTAFVGNQEPQFEEKFFSLDEFSASTQEARVDMAGHRITPIEGGFEVEARLRQIRFKLRYSQRGTPIHLARNAHGPQAWEVSNWLAYMTSAQVSGEVTVGGRDYQLTSAVGYHDHNWGKWLFPAREFYWVSFQDLQQKLSLDLGHGVGFEPGYTAVLDIGEERILFPAAKRSQPMLGPMQRQGLFRYPTSVQVKMSSQDDRYHLDLSWKPQVSALVSQIPLAIFEQRSLIEGKLSGARELSFSQEGFSEWTDLILG